MYGMENKRDPVYGFGLGKRDPAYGFGLGKRGEEKRKLERFGRDSE